MAEAIDDKNGINRLIIINKIQMNRYKLKFVVEHCAAMFMLSTDPCSYYLFIEDANAGRVKIILPKSQLIISRVRFSFRVVVVVGWSDTTQSIHMSDVDLSVANTISRHFI